MKGARTIIVVAAMAVLLVPSAAYSEGVFDNLILSPRARAMGGAFVAVSDDETAIFTNPAGLAGQSTIGVYGSYVDLFGYPYFNLGSLSAVVPTSYGTVGFGARVFTVQQNDVELEKEYTITLGQGFSLMKDVHSSLAFGYAANLYGLSFEAPSVSGDDLGFGEHRRIRRRRAGHVARADQLRVLHEEHQQPQARRDRTRRTCRSGSRRAWPTARTAASRRPSRCRSRTTRTSGPVSASSPRSPTSSTCGPAYRTTRTGSRPGSAPGGRRFASTTATPLTPLCPAAITSGWAWRF